MKKPPMDKNGNVLEEGDSVWYEEMGYTIGEIKGNRAYIVEINEKVTIIKLWVSLTELDLMEDDEDDYFDDDESAEVDDFDMFHFWHNAPNFLSEDED